MAEQKYPQSAETNEYRYIDFEWLNEIATGLTSGAEKHPGETWRSIPAEEHAARALRHLSMWLAGDRSDSHIINASMRCMMARELERIEDAELDEMMELSEKAADAMETMESNFDDAHGRLITELDKYGYLCHQRSEDHE